MNIKAGFLTKAVMATYGANKWRMVEDLDYLAADGTFIRVLHGFIHDLASIPRPFNLLFRVNGKHREPSILHDWLYDKQGLITPYKRLTRQECDALFLEAMKSCGVGYFQRNMMYYGVRVGGFIAWNDKK